jgi:hypothetical protein
MMTVPLRGAKAAGRVALVDDADYELVSPYRWWVLEERRPGRKPYGPYAATSSGPGGAPVLMHKMLTGWPRTDHVNHDGLDNQRPNLRPATQGQNMGNARPQAGRTSQYKGVGWNRQCQKWQARIKVNYKGRHLGLFAAEEDAARAYDAAAVKEFGEFACLNFP